MIFRKYFVTSLLLAIVFSIFVYLTFWAQTREYLKFTTLGFAILAVITISLQIFIVTRHNNSIYRFLRTYSVNEPFPRFISSFNDKSFEYIGQELNRIAKSYHKVKIEKETEHRFLTYIIDHIDIALLAVDKEGETLVSNGALEMLFPEIKTGKLEDIITIYPAVGNTVKRMTPGKTEVIRHYHENRMKQILVKMSSFELGSISVNLFSFDDITKEIAKEEVMNWQKLLRVLRHEIMNSITPITTLSGNLIEIYDDEGLPDKAYGDYLSILDASYRGFKAIDKRGRGLMDFIASYKSLTHIPEPTFKKVILKKLIEDLLLLYPDEQRKYSIDIVISCPGNIDLVTDENLLNQVLVNLIKNASESLQQVPGSKIMKIGAYRTDTEISIFVSDNGRGIPPDRHELIFVPFYTTKKRGSGIGLSLSRQIMLRLGGSISVQSIPEFETTFILSFKV
ncbi:MAG: hypothetical protein JSV24_00380 [Bacteroidales bacterium]|nr:MAG: hypothetical protein JSV24_00380 [Bacteroidales bacterium]